MKVFSARRALSAGVVAAASVAAFAVPSAASAALPGHCKGSSTEGAGSSFQLEAEELWKKGFNTNKAGCTKEGEKPTIGYRSIGSGAGYKEWHEKELYGTVGFVGTDNTVNAAEKTGVEEQADAGKTSKVETIPVEQGAVAIVVNLPAGCTANSTIAPNRLAIDQATLEGIYKGSVTKWSELVSSEGTGNELKGTCVPAEDAIIPVVRNDSSGTTHIFKKSLFNNDQEKLANESGGENTWGELAEGTKVGATTLNQSWPTAAKVVHAKTTTNTGVLKEVTETPGSIGYADLSQARNPANGGFTGQSASRFWLEVEASDKVKVTKKGTTHKRKYADPASNGDVEAKAESNCKKTEFSNGVGSFPPPAVTAAWNEVAAKRESKSYPICGLTYVLALTNYEAYASHGGNAAEAETVKDYVGFIGGKAGAKEIKGHDFAPLPKTLLASTEEGFSGIED
jgi:ABC-type phosphate transport system substrate-binding protein